MRLRLAGLALLSLNFLAACGSNPQTQNYGYGYGSTGTNSNYNSTGSGSGYGDSQFAPSTYSYSGQQITYSQIPMGRYVVGQDPNFTILSLLSDLTTLCNQYSGTSVKNYATPWGNPVSPYSAYNPVSATPPVICDFDGQNCNIAGYLTKNYALPGALDPDTFCYAF